MLRNEQIYNIYIYITSIEIRRQINNTKTAKTTSQYQNISKYILSTHFIKNNN